MESAGIVVLGMHRSGTSACVGLLRLYGAYLGEVIDSQPDNPKGFWENKNALSLDDEILRLLQCRWDWPWIFPQQWINRIPDELSRRRDAIIAELCVNRFWAIKDPRMCLLWPWWQAGLAKTNSQIMALLCLRHPGQVAQSLARRNQMETSQALLLWAQHVLFAEQHSRAMPRVLVFYDHILASPAETITHIENRLGITFPVSPKRDVFDDFISAELHHHHDHECPGSAIGHLCQEIFTLCRKEDALQQPEKWDEFRARLAPLLQEDGGERLPSLLAEILRLDDLQATQCQQIIEQDAEYKRLFERSSDEIYKLTHETDSIIVQKDQEIEAVMLQLEQAAKQIDCIRDERDQMLGSRSWRLTTPLRTLGYRLRGVKRAMTKSPSVIQHSPINSSRGNNFELHKIQEELEKTPLFDSEWYLAHYPDVAEAGLDPLQHYIDHGVAEGRNPNSYFDTAWYVKTYPDVAAAGMNPLLHYIEHGAAAGWNPCRFFDTKYYLRHNRDVAQSGMNPLHHFLAHGRKEGRKTHGLGYIAASTIQTGECNSRRVLVADYRIPRPDISAGELSTVGILHDLCALGFEVVFMPDDFLPDPHYERLLSAPGLSFITSASKYASPTDYLRQEGHTFSLFYFFRIQVAETMLEIAKAASPRARIIFHAPDLHYLRETRQAWLEKDPAQAARARITEEREMRIFEQSDVVVVVSPVEQQILRERLSQKKIVCFPGLHVPIVDQPAGEEGRKDLFFLAGYTHPPNVDAVLWFVTEIWPLIHARLPGAIFHILGAEAPEQVRRLGELPAIRYGGYVENLHEALATMRVGVAPLRYGAGVKGKVATTMGMGIPCVCTTIAAEGMHLHNGEQALLADTPEDFAGAVIKLYTDAEFWRAIASNGYRHAARYFGKDADLRMLLYVLREAHALPIDLYIDFCKNIDANKLHVPVPPDVPEISIIIPVYNQWHFTRDCLHSLLMFCNGSRISYEILLADDNSTDESTTAAAQYPGVRVIRTEKNCGFLRNCNNAAQHAKGKYILLLNNDTIVLPGWLDALYSTMEQDENIAICGSKMLYPDGTIQEAGAVIFTDASGWNIGRGHQQYEKPFQVVRRVDYVSGCSMLIKLSIWQEIGGFDDRYENAYYEDTDLCFSARNLGYSVAYQPESEVIHFENVSYTEGVDRNKTILMQKNAKIFLEKWGVFLQSTHLPPTSDWQTAMKHIDGSFVDTMYEESIRKEIAHFKNIEDVHALPPIFHYWSNKYLTPLCLECGFTGVDDFFAKYLYAAAKKTDMYPRFISIGAGNCDLEIRVAKLLRRMGLQEFRFDCLELNPYMLERARQDALNNKFSDNFLFIESDFNTWVPKTQYSAIMANHSLHHVVNLERLFDSIKSALHPLGYFVTNDMIGRNGHQRWPESLKYVQQYWQEMPNAYKYNHLLSRYEDEYDNWDCSKEGFEGIRAQDILPLLVERFNFHLFLGFVNVIAPFIDRAFGHNFNPDSKEDRNFIDRIHAVDELCFQSGELKPTQMFAVMTITPPETQIFSRGLTPEKSIRRLE